MPNPDNEVKIEEGKRIPINRNNLFYSKESFDYELMMGKNYIEQDMNQVVVLYELDLEFTNRDALYNDANSENLRYKTPKEIHVVYELEQADLRAYKQKQSVGAYIKLGKLSFGVYQATLDELECDIHRGDYIGVPVDETHMEYFTVTDDGRVNYDNEKTMYGTVPFFRIVECAPVMDQGEFAGK